MKDKHEKKGQTSTNKPGHEKSDHTQHDKHHQHADKHHADKQHVHHDKHHQHADKHHADKQHAHHDKHHQHADKHHAHHKGAAANPSHGNSSHPVRHRSRSFSRKDTAHSMGSVKGHSHKDHDRGSASSAEVHHHHDVKYENTYKMLPDFRFLESKIKNIMLTVFQENIKEKLYDASVMGQKCKLSSEIIKEKVKSLDMHRFKVICHVLAVQSADQSMVVTSRCLWDQRFDNSASVTVKHDDYYVLGLVFAVYAE